MPQKRLDFSYQIWSNFLRVILKVTFKFHSDLKWQLFHIILATSQLKYLILILFAFSGRGRAQQNAPAPGAGAPPPQQQQSAPAQVGRGRARGGQPPAQAAPQQQAPRQQQAPVANAAEQMAKMSVKEERPRQNRGIGKI